MTGTTYVAPELVDDGALVWTSSATNGGAAVMETAHATVWAVEAVVDETPPLDPGQENSYTATPADFTLDDNIFDVGAAVSRGYAVVPVSGSTTANEGDVVQVRSWSDEAGSGSGWFDVVVGSSGGWVGDVVVPHVAGSPWSYIEARVKDSSQPKQRATTRFAAGHVVGLMGQSEPYRMLHSGGGSGKTPITNPEQVQLSTGNVEYVGATGTAVIGFPTERVFMTDAVARAFYFTHGVEVITANTDDKFMFVDMTVPSSGRFQLSDDGEERRRWSDLIAKLDGAGWQDGVRPGLIYELWTNEEANTATNFKEAFFPFYTGLHADGVTPYTLSDPITTDVFPGRPGTDTMTRQHDHILWDLSGQGRGLFDAAETKLCIGHHRYDPTDEMDNALVISGGGSGALDTEMQAQEIIRAQFRDMLADPVFGQIALPQGPEPLNYENGFANTGGGGEWSDFIHPGQGEDGLKMFARHMAHGALHGLGIAGTTIPEFDQSYFEPGGTYAEFWSTTGPVTNTRKLRGVADLSATSVPSDTPPGGAVDGSTVPVPDHWTDVFGFEFNGQPVERAEIQPNGRVRVYPPASVGTADWSRDRIFFGRGGGVGTLDWQVDPFYGGWMNHPVVAPADVGLAGFDVAGYETGVALRPMPSDAVMTDAAYRAAALDVTAGAFGNPVASGAGVTRIRWEMRAAMPTATNDVYLFGYGGGHVRLLWTRNMNLSLYVAGGGASVTNADAGVMIPGVRYDIALDIDYGTGDYSVSVDGVDVITGTLGGTRTEFNSARSPNFLAEAGPYAGTTNPATDHGALEVERMASYFNGSATPEFELEASDGAAAWLADGWYAAGAVV